MRNLKFQSIESRFISYFQEEAKRLNDDFRDVSCKVEVRYPPEDSARLGCFSMQLSCLLLRAEFEGADNISLGIQAYDWNKQFTIDSLISWGDPSGKIEAEVFEKPAEINEKNLDIVQNMLPSLVSKLRQILRENSTAT